MCWLLLIFPFSHCLNKPSNSSSFWRHGALQSFSLGGSLWIQIGVSPTFFCPVKNCLLALHLWKCWACPVLSLWIFHQRPHHSVPHLLSFQGRRQAPPCRFYKLQRTHVRLPESLFEVTLLWLRCGIWRGWKTPFSNLVYLSCLKIQSGLVCIPYFEFFVCTIWIDRYFSF